jgi:hypothetical protein
MSIIIIMTASLVERVLLIRILNVVMSAVEVAAHGQPNAFLFFLAGFVIADYFAGSDISVFWDVGEFDKETCIGSRNVLNALEKAPAFVAKALFPQWL